MYIIHIYILNQYYNTDIICGNSSAIFTYLIHLLEDINIILKYIGTLSLIDFTNIRD